MEAASLICTGYLMLRNDARCCLAAMAAAVLLVADAWFDVTTAPPGLAGSAALALLTELAAAATCLTLAVRVLGRVLGMRAAVELHLAGAAAAGRLGAVRVLVL